ncbi:MAG: ABC transporter substrate-binding protein [Calditerricola sp.]|nr:ABC transporter substrate-binding protein [Calditerricola sp.]
MRRIGKRLKGWIGKRAVLLGLAGLVALLGGCQTATQAPGDGARNASAGSGSEGGDLEPVTVMLDWYPNAVHAFLYTALEKGYFAEEGLQVAFNMPAETNDPLRLVASGEVMLALSYQPQVVMARAEGIPVQSVAAVVRHPLNHLMVPADSPIRSPKDLIGKKVGYSGSPVDEAFVKTMVERDGAAYDGVKMVDVGWDLVPALSTRKVDALMGGFINHEKLLMEKEGFPIRTIDPTRYGVPDYYELVLIASEQTVKEKAETIRKFWRAAQKGQQYVVEHPDEGLNILLAHQQSEFPLDPDVEKQSLQMLLPLMDARDKPFGWQDEASWDAVVTWMKDTRLIQQAVAGNSCFVNVAE